MVKLKAKMKELLEYLKAPNKLFDTVKFFFVAFIILSSGYLILNYVPFVAKYDHYIIVTGSMEPIISVNDVVIIDTSVKVDNLEIGDIIAFKTDINDDGKDDVVVHYLSSINDINGIKTYKTHPEVSNTEDDWDLHDEDILGLHTLTIPKIGGVLRFATSTIGRVTLLIDIVVIYFLFEFILDPKKEEITEEKTN